MLEFQILLATKEDEKWLKEIWNSQLFWEFSTIWWRYWNRSSFGEFWYVVKPFGFVHGYLRKRDAYTIIEEIQSIQPGVGKMLLNALSRPIELNCEADNAVALAWYQKRGFKKINSHFSKDGKKKFYRMRLCVE